MSNRDNCPKCNGTNTYFTGEGAKEKLVCRECPAKKPAKKRKSRAKKK